MKIWDGMASILQINTLDRYSCDLIKDALLYDYLQLLLGLSDNDVIINPKEAFCQ